MTEIMDQLFAICDALPSVGPSQAIVDCDRIPHMPDITFSLPDADLTLSAEQYVLRVGLHSCQLQHVYRRTKTVSPHCGTVHLLLTQLLHHLQVKVQDQEQCISGFMVRLCRKNARAV